MATSPTLACLAHVFFSTDMATAGGEVSRPCPQIAPQARVTAKVGGQWLPPGPAVDSDHSGILHTRSFPKQPANAGDRDTGVTTRGQVGGLHGCKGLGLQRQERVCWKNLIQLKTALAARWEEKNSGGDTTAIAQGGRLMSPAAFLAEAAQARRAASVPALRVG